MKSSQALFHRNTRAKFFRPRRSYPLTAYLWFFWLICFSAAWIWYSQIRLDEKDFLVYATLVQESADLRSKSALELTPLRQFRKGVQKDLWKMQDGKREKISLASQSSDLLLSQKTSKIKAEEHLFEIQGTSLDPIGPISHFTAAKGIVDFRKNSFNASGIEAKGPKSAKISSASMALDHKNLLLNGCVEISGELDGLESFALADRATMSLADKRLLLESSSFKRVLFWQEGLELSAPKIYISKTAQGIGDVRCSFNAKERELTERFKKEIR